MGKAINALVGKSSDSDTQTIRLTVVDFFQPHGERVKTVFKEKNRNPQVKIVTEIREVTYLYDKKTTKGWEIVKEVSMPQEDVNSEEFQAPVVVEEVIRDFRVNKEANDVR